MGALFDRPERWVRAGEEAATCRETIHGQEARCTMSVRPGRYAFAFAHDEDGDGRFDRDFLGIPSEGYGFSNNVRPSLSLPSWQSAAFVVRPAPSGELIVPITLSRRVVARLVGARVETVIRVLSRWEKEAFIETHEEGGFVVRDVSRLKNEARGTD